MNTERARVARLAARQRYRAADSDGTQQGEVGVGPHWTLAPGVAIRESTGVFIIEPTKVHRRNVSRAGERFGLDYDEKFAMASTFKWLLAAAVLAKVGRAELRLEQRVTFTEKHILAHAPVTSEHLIGSMERVLLGTVLSEPSRQMLIQWMINSPAE